MQTLLCSDGLTILKDKKGNIVLDITKIVLTPIAGESKEELWKRIEETLFNLSSDAYGWHQEWESTNRDSEDDNE